MDVGIYISTMLISAFLLSWIQPLIAKVFLPILGGSPSVWQTCMVFFQSAILLGYTYAHVISRYFRLRTQLWVHLLIVFSAFMLLPFSKHDIIPPTVKDAPLIWLLIALSKKILLPTFVVCTTAPLLQKWFSHSTHQHANDPYFLYAASNSGSLLALLSFPFLLEPLLGISIQTTSWGVLYVCFAALIALLTIMLWRIKEKPMQSEDTLRLSYPDWRIKIRWCLLALVPSSLFLGVTTAITTDIASVPLFWIMPLTIYMMTFILCFSKNPRLPHHFLLDNQAFLFIPLFTILPTISSGINSWTLIEAHLIAFFSCAMVCHGEFYRLRPDKHYLTQYYIWLAVGGLLGGLFNSILAPILFTTPIEFPLMIVLACLLRPTLDQKEHRYFLINDLKVPSILGLSCLLIFVFNQNLFLAFPLHYYDALKLIYYAMLILVLLGYQRPVRFALGLAILFISNQVFFNNTNTTVHRERNFFGTLKIRENKYLHMRYLLNGTTTHGTQALNPEQKPAYSYYVPVFDIIAAVNKLHSHARVAAIGLGVGTMSCIIKAPKNELTFYEIDSAVVKLAQDTTYFHYLSQCPPAGGIVIGDGRISLQKAAANYYNLILIDAFSSDSIPAHLLNLNAVELYLTKITTDGVLAFHISNRYMDLAPVLSQIAKKLNLNSFIKTFTESNAKQGISSSVWVILTPSAVDKNIILEQSGWKMLSAKANAPLWTDNFSNVIQILK